MSKLLVHARTGLATLLVAFAACSSAAAVDLPPFQHATECMALQRYEAAAKFFQTFIEASAGDPLVPKARQQLYTCTVALAKEWAAQGREVDAAGLYLGLAKDPLTPAESKDQLLKQPSQIVAAALADARQKHLFAKTLQLHNDYQRLFPDKPALLTAEEIAASAADGLLAASKDKFNALALADVATDYYGEQEPPWDVLAKRNGNEPLKLGYLRALADIGWAGRFLAEYETLPENSPLRTDPSLVALKEKMHLARAQTWSNQGNLAAAEQAVDAAKPLMVSPNNLATIKILQDILTKRVGGEPRQLAFAGNLTGKSIWQDPGSGFKDAKDIILAPNAEVTVNPGFFLDGGLVEVQPSGRLSLRGTPQQPIIFRNVSLQCEPGGLVEAENTIFIDCSFTKSGGNAVTPTLWSLSGCILYRTQFANFGSAEYSVRTADCAWVECMVPHRDFESLRPTAIDKTQHTQIVNCSFYRGSIAASVTWVSRECNFIRCSVNHQDEYDKPTPMVVALFAPPSDPLPTNLRAGTLISHKGDLRYVVSPRAFGTSLPVQFWALLPTDRPNADQARARK